jgi:uncharacterized coiled-coil protein SlyX
MESGSKVRELIHDLSASKFHQAADGSLTIKDVRLLASGTWTDSSWGTPLFYPEAVLKEYAENWFDNPFWCRHGGGVPRSITDKVGEVVKPRYHDKAVHGDIVLHGKTQTSRDLIEMVIAGLANAVSVEHGGRERWDPDEGIDISEEIIFYGAAAVNKGACDICTINNESRSTAEADMNVKELEVKLSEADSKIKELSEASAAKDTRLSELESKLEGLPEDKSEELEAKIAELEVKLAEVPELEARLKKIEDTPLPGVTLSGEGESELGDVTLDPIQTDSEGMTRRIF